MSLPDATTSANSGARELAGMLSLNAEQAKEVLEESTSTVSQVAEYFSVANGRLYYSSKRGTSWEPPSAFIVREALVDMSLYNLTAEVALQCFQAVNAIQAHRPWRVAQGALRRAAKLLSNITTCGNSNERYRTLRLSNPTLAATTFSVPAVMKALQLAGFRMDTNSAGEGVLMFPESHDLSAAQALAARMDRICCEKGHSGTAQAHDNDNSGGSSSNAAAAAATSRWHGAPGFVHQAVIFECSCCEAPINDGSERLYSRTPAASPPGQFRYSCKQCSAFHMCESCWDRYSAGDDLHIRSHEFEHHGPRTSRRSGSNSNGGWPDKRPPISAQAVERRRQRHGR